MCQHICLRSEHSGSIAKTHMQKSAFCAWQFLESIRYRDIIYIYTTWTKVFDNHENLYTNSIKVDLLIKVYVLKLKEIQFIISNSQTTHPS